MNVIISNKSSLEVLNFDGMGDYFFSLGLLNGTCNNGEDATNQFDHLQTSSSGSYGTDVTWHMAECDTRGRPGMRFKYYWQENATSMSFGAHFIAAAVVIARGGTDKVVDNGYNLGRDQLVAIMTANNTGRPIASYSNELFKKREEYRSTVVYNDTELLSNVTANDLAFNISTDGRVPVLLIQKTNISEGESPIEVVPQAKRNVGHSIRVVQAPYLWATLLVLVITLVGLAPFTQ